MAERYFKKLGKKLFDNGYNFLPIIPAHAKHSQAGKAPSIKGWQKNEVSKNQVNEWVSKFPFHNIGINTRFTPAVDIDCTDSDGVEFIKNFVVSEFGQSPLRVGNAPKCLLLFATEDPFTKVKSHTWKDDWGDTHHVEILGSGQQFVAFGIHPKTQREYEWVNGDSPLDTHSDMDLPLLTLEGAQRIALEFDKYAKGQGWKKVDKIPAINGGDEAETWAGNGVASDEDEWFDEDMFKVKWDGTVDELAEILEDLPPEETYDKWFPVIAALKDAESEPDEYREIAREWSAKADSYSEEGFDDKWENGAFNRIVGQVSSITSLVKKVERIRVEAEVLEHIIPSFDDCLDLADWKANAGRLRDTPVFGTVRDVAVEKALEIFKQVTGMKKVPRSAVEDLAFDYSQFDPPAWLDPWVFTKRKGLFIDKRTFVEIGPYAFNHVNAKAMRETGVKKKADLFAAEDCPVPVVDGVMYYPLMHGGIKDNEWSPALGLDDPRFFTYEGSTYLNTFDPDSLPEMPETYSKADLRAIKTVKNFFEVQFPDDKERRYIMDWLSWVVNNPTRKINYMMIVVGCEGSGKSIIKKFMTYMLGGRRNVGTVSNTVLQKSFNSWATGDILKVIEELSVPGHRYDVVNILKEPITNESLQTEAKFATAEETVNTASYLAFTNDKGGLPVGEESRRYLVVSSAFQEREQVLRYSAANPRFFKSFELAFLRHSGAIRKWFGEWEYSANFNNEGHAPEDTKAKAEMRELNTDIFIDAMENAISSGDVPGITEEVIHSRGVSNVLEKIGMKASSATTRRLSDMGYRLPGGVRHRVRLDGEQGTVYVRNVDKWVDLDGEVDLVAIANTLFAHLKSLDPMQQDDEV